MGVETNIFEQDFDRTAPGELPPFFIQNSQDSAANWSTSSDTAASSPHAARTSASASTNSAYLIAFIPVDIQLESELRFDHNYDIETNFDGAVLELSINQGNWQEWTVAGGSFTQNAYDAVIASNYNSPIGGQSAWTGNSGGFVTTIAQFPPAAVGQTIRLRWHMASDSTVESNQWAIDNIAISGFVCCDYSPPTLSISASDPLALELDTSNTGEFAITSDQAIGMDLEITYSESGTATSGNDYSPLPGSITLPANQATVTMRLTALSDSEVEGNESVILTLQDTSAYSLGNSQSTVTIEDLPFDAYRAENFGSAIDNVAEHEDFDSDGIANLLEYAFRLDPTQATTLPIELTQQFEAGNIELRLVYNEDTDLPDVSYTVETSPDLNAASWTQAGVSIQRGSTTEGLQTVTATITTSEDARFMRIRVERITP